MPQKLHLDFETTSVVDLRKCGVYVYAAHPLTRVLLARYRLDNGPVLGWRPGDPYPFPMDTEIEIHAWNAAFERRIWEDILSNRHGWPVKARSDFHCTMVAASYWGLPLSLDMASNAMGRGITKDKDGHRLMMKMAKPRGIDPFGEYTWWDKDEPSLLARLDDYCGQDVVAESDISKEIPDLPAQERELYLLDQKMNDRGVHLDREFITKAQQLVDTESERLALELGRVTHGEVTSPNQVAKLTLFLRSHGTDTHSLSKDTIADLLDDEGNPLRPVCRQVLEIRQQAAKSSTAKLRAMANSVCDDGYIRGMLQFYAAHTGRWAGRLAQPHNYPRGEIKYVRRAIEDIMDGSSIEWIRDFHGPVMATISSCLRGAFTAGAGRLLGVQDFEQIEARVTAWLAGEKHVLALFSAGEDVYKHTAAAIYGVPLDKIDDYLRQVGKVGDLALGFGGGIGAFQAMAKNYRVDISDQEAEAIKVRWRRSHPATEGTWWAFSNAIIAAVAKPGSVFPGNRHVSYVVWKGHLLARLPSGRYLVYRDIRVEDDPLGRPQISYMGVNSYTRKWERLHTYGGHAFQNAVQAIARDILALAMLRADAAGFDLRLTVHDELLAEIRKSDELRELLALLIINPSWAAGLPIDAKGYAARRYRK